MLLLGLSSVLTALMVLCTAVAGQSSTPATRSPTQAAAPSVTAVSACHAHETVQFCMYGQTEYKVIGASRTEEFEAQYTDCHSHGTDTFCMRSDGSEVELIVEAEETAEPGQQEESEDEHTAENCHFHAGVEHCVGHESTTERQCGRTVRNYNVPLRIGLLFVIFGTGALGVFAPIITASFTRWTTSHILFILLKQFGTGVVISTAFVHLFTHASLMFTNECLGELSYEATTAAVFMAGLFISFAVEYLGARFVIWQQGKKTGTPSDTEATPTSTVDNKSANDSNASTRTTAGRVDDQETHSHIHGYAEEQVGVLVLEAGIIFHSLLIGLTLVVAGDSFFLTLFAVILFHQMFEGIALGTCIAGLSPKTTNLTRKFAMATAFALITPIGMAIGIGVLDRFNGNDPSALIAIGTLDALSAGILAWVGLVEMLAMDWMHGLLLNAGKLRTTVGMVSLVAGMVGMSVLGKWA